MHRWSLPLLMLVATACRAQPDSTSQRLANLTHPESTFDAEQSLCHETQQDPRIAAAIDQQLPALLRSAVFVPHAEAQQQVLYAMADLAGCLHLASSVPSLVERLTQRNSNERLVTFYTSAHLTYDPVARALATIGNPSVPGVSPLLRSEEQFVRSRAARILVLINTETARKAIWAYLRDHPDPEMVPYLSSHTEGIPCAGSSESEGCPQ